MLKALIEVLGAFYLAAPASEGKGHRQRIFALALVVGLLIVGAWLSLRV